MHDHAALLGKVSKSSVARPAFFWRTRAKHLYSRPDYSVHPLSQHTARLLLGLGRQL